MRLALTLAGALALLTLAACGGSTVPDLRGLTASQAGQALSGAGLALGEIAYDAAASGTTWTVCAQSVAAGASLDGGGAVGVTLAGAPPVAVPKLVGLSAKRAQSRLKAAQLRLGTTKRRYDEKIAAGGVTKQTPAAGEIVPEGSAIAVVLSKGRAPVAVPKTVGQSRQAAERRLKRAGFTVTISLVYSDAAKGEVVAQKPSSGLLQPGRTVHLSVSRGVSLVAVPDVYAILGTIPGSLAGEKLKASVAVDWINQHIADRGLSVVIDNSGIDPAEGGRGYRQYPRAGTVVPRGSVIRMEFTSGPDRVLDL